MRVSNSSVSDKQRVSSIIVTARGHLVSVNPVEWLNWNEATMTAGHDFSDCSPCRRATTHAMVMVSRWRGLITLPAPRLKKVVI
jgi:hypothetical protein